MKTLRVVSIVLALLLLAACVPLGNNIAPRELRSGEVNGIAWRELAQDSHEHALVLDWLEGLAPQWPDDFEMPRLTEGLFLSDDFHNRIRLEGSCVVYDGFDEICHGPRNEDGEPFDCCRHIYVNNIYLHDRDGDTWPVLLVQGTRYGVRVAQVLDERRFIYEGDALGVFDVQTMTNTVIETPPELSDYGLLFFMEERGGRYYFRSNHARAQAGPLHLFVLDDLTKPTLALGENLLANIPEASDILGAELGDSWYVHGMALCPNERYLAVSTDTLYIFDLEEQTLAGHIQIPRIPDMNNNLMGADFLDCNTIIAAYREIIILDEDPFHYAKFHIFEITLRPGTESPLQTMTTRPVTTTTEHPATPPRGRAQGIPEPPLPPDELFHGEVNGIRWREIDLHGEEHAQVYAWLSEEYAGPFVPLPFEHQLSRNQIVFLRGRDYPDEAVDLWSRNTITRRERLLVEGLRWDAQVVEVFSQRHFIYRPGFPSIYAVFDMQRMVSIPLTAPPDTWFWFAGVFNGKLYFTDGAGGVYTAVLDDLNHATRIELGENLLAGIPQAEFGEAEAGCREFFLSPNARYVAVTYGPAVQFFDLQESAYVGTVPVEHIRACFVRPFRITFRDDQTAYVFAIGTDMTTMVGGVFPIYIRPRAMEIILP